jgi:hypothetical protein
VQSLSVWPITTIRVFCWSSRTSTLQVDVTVPILGEKRGHFGAHLESWGCAPYRYGIRPYFHGRFLCGTSHTRTVSVFSISLTGWYGFFTAVIGSTVCLRLALLYLRKFNFTRQCKHSSMVCSNPARTTPCCITFLDSLKCFPTPCRPTVQDAISDT